MRRKLAGALLLIGLLGAWLPAICQSIIDQPEYISVEDGLSNPLLTAMAQDRRGFLWAASLQGLNRYDGAQIVRFMADGEKGSLPASGVKCLLPLGDTLLVGTDKGIAIMDRHGHVEHVVELQSKLSKREYANQVQVLARDAHGQFWASTPNSLFRLNNRLEVAEEFVTQRDPIASRLKNLYRTMALPTGEMLFRFHDGWRYWSPNSRGLETLEEGAGAKYKHLPRVGFYSACLASNRYLVSHALNELTVMDLASGRLSTFTLPDPAVPYGIIGSWEGGFALNSHKGIALYTLADRGGDPMLGLTRDGLLPGAVVSQVIKDDEGNYWVASNAGLVKFLGSGHSIHNLVLPSMPGSHAGTKEVIDLFTHGENLWVGTNGDGFYNVDMTTGSVSRHAVGPGPGVYNIVWHFHHVGGDTLWLGTQQGLMYFTTGTQALGRLPMPRPGVVDSVAITTLFEDSRKRIWIGLGRRRGAAVYNPAERSFRVFPYGPGGYPFPFPMAAGEDARGNIWFISDATGDLAMWDDHKEEFKVVQVPGVDGTINVESNGFLLNKEEDEIWYGILPGGLVRYGMADGRSTVYGVQDGLAPGFTSSIVKDTRNRLWMGTSLGISCLDPATGAVINYTRSDGLAASTYTALHYDPASNRISAGAAGVISWFEVPEVLADDRPMRTWLTGVDVNGRPVKLPANGKLSLGPNEGNITVKFSAINMVDGPGNRHQYRLNNGEWINLGKQSTISFASINAGVYRVEVRSARKRGQFGPAQVLLDFTVRPRFTNTIWFYLLSLAVVTLMAWGWYRYRLHGLRRLEAVRSQISRDLHDDIGSRLTNINLISQIIRGGAAAKEELHGLLMKVQEESEEITRSLREIIWSIDPHNDQLASAMPRLLAYASQLLEAKGMEVRATIGELEGTRFDMARRRDISLIFKEAVHNAAKHSAATTVEIGAHVQCGAFHLWISDNGRGFDPHTAALGNGVRNMRSRADLRHWRLHVTSTPGEGARISLVAALK